MELSVGLLVWLCVGLTGLGEFLIYVFFLCRVSAARRWLFGPLGLLFSALFPVTFYWGAFSVLGGIRGDHNSGGLILISGFISFLIGLSLGRRLERRLNASKSDSESGDNGG